MKAIIIILILTILSHVSFAQSQGNPGYLGKTQYISYDYSYYISLFTYNFHVFHFHKLGYNKVYKRNKMFTVSIEICKKEVDDIINNPDAIQHISFFDKNISVENAWFKSKRGALAPMGTNKGIGIGAHFKNTIQDKYTIIDNRGV